MVSSMIDVKQVKEYLTWPWLVTVPLILFGYGCSVFFVGTDSPLLAPAVACLLAVSAIAVYPNFKNGWDIPTNYTFLFVMLFWGWLVASNFWSTIPYVSTTFTIILSILPGFFAVCILAHGRETWTNIMVGALWIALLSFAVWALVQFAVPALYKMYGPRIHHPMLNPNNLAGLFNMGLFPAMGLFFLAKKRPALILSGLIMAIFYGALMVTQSRGGFYACVVSALVFLPVVALKNPDGLPWKKIAFIALIAVAIPVIGNAYHPGSLAENLVSAEAMKNTRSLEDRFYLWESTLKMVEDFPWFGAGLASFYFYYPRYRLPEDRSDGFFSHMDPLQFWAEMGFMAPLLFYGVLICVLLRTIAAIKAGGPDLRKRLEIIAPFCGMLALTGHTHLTFHLYMPGILIPLSGLMAYWYLATERALGNKDERKRFAPEGKWKRATLVGLVFIMVLTGGWVARVSAATYVMKSMHKSVGQGDQQMAERKLSWAGIIAPGSFGRIYEYEARFRIQKVWDNAKTMERDSLKALYDEAIYYLDEAQERNPAFTTLWDLRARLYYAVNGILLNDGYAQSVAMFNKVIEINPLAADSRIAYANILMANGEIKKAAYILESGLKWPRPKGTTDLNFLLLLAKLKAQLGDQGAHDTLVEEAKRRARSYGMVIK